MRRDRTLGGSRRPARDDLETGAVAECLGLEEAWMRLSCSAGAAVHDGASSAAARRTPTARLARRQRHPAVVARLRAAQRFGQRELKSVPHA